jgi:hypothetical protein
MIVLRGDSQFAAFTVSSVVQLRQKLIQVRPRDHSLAVMKTMQCEGEKRQGGLREGVANSPGVPRLTTAKSEAIDQLVTSRVLCR